MTDKEVLDWAEHHLLAVTGDYTLERVKGIIWIKNSGGSRHFTSGSSLRDCVEKANKQ